ncbi:MAG TPA: hypothetical protein VG518_06180, partial [Solirubrobacterales bacterium]|nr:hypothetical protein [Solirubrobacterales bacterium]
MVSAGSYILSAAGLAALGLSLGASAVLIRRRLLSTWEGAPARLVEAVLAMALLVWLGELLGTLGLLYAWTLLASSLLISAALAWKLSPPSAGGVWGGGSRTGPPPAVPPSPRDGIRSQGLLSLITVGVIAVVFAHWGLVAKDALDRGIFNFDSLWYHMPFAVDMAQSHSVTGLHYTDTVFTNWFYPQNTELLHAVGVLFAHRDTLSLFINFAFLGLAFLSAWCIGRPYGRGHLSVVATALVLECHTLVVRQPGAAKNDRAAAALLLAAAAILVTAWSASRDGKPALQPGWALAAAGLATGLAAGTKLTVMAMAAALSLAVLVLAPRRRRLAAAGWWFVPGLLGGGYWYLRNLIAAGNPLPEVAHLGPISLPHPERLQIARPDFSIVHYATDTGVWRDYFLPGLHDQFGALWPVVLGGALLGGGLALARGRDRVVRALGAVALFGLLAYLFTPLSASGADGAPEAFAINVRYAVPALLMALALLPLARALDGRRAQWLALGGMLIVLALTDRSDAVLRDPSRVFALGLALFLVLIPAALLFARSRGAGRGAVIAGFVALGVAILAAGFPLQRHYLHDRFRNELASESVP